MFYVQVIAAGAVLLIGSAIGTQTGADTAAGSKLPVRGIVRPVNQAAIAVDLPIRVSKLHFREAQDFKKGQTLVTFDCERLLAEHAAAEAVHKEMRLGLESQVYLEARGAVGKLDLEIARARVDKARAEASGLGARLKQCTVVAPFDGRVVELKINEHEIPTNGQPFISIVDETAFEIDMIVPSTWLKSLAPGTSFTFTVDETELSYRVVVLRMGASVDPVSQTVKVIAGFSAPDGRVLSGMSGTLVLAGAEASR